MRFAYCALRIIRADAAQPHERRARRKIRQATAALQDFDLAYDALGLGRVKTFSCKRSELEEVATRAIFPDFDYALIAAING
jgi:hypothetical protein